MSQCFSFQLGRNFSDPLVGLDVSPTGIASPAPAHLYQCCRKDCSSQLKTSQNKLRICSIPKRLELVQQLLNQFQSLNQEQPLKIHKWTKHHQVLHFYRKIIDQRYLKSRLNFENPRGRVFCSSSRSLADRPSPVIWTCAIIFAWRIGEKPSIMTLDADSTHQVNGSKNPPPVVFIDQIKPLRNPTYAYQFAAQVKWCENALVPLWMDTSSEHLEAEKHFNRLKQQIAGIPEDISLKQLQRSHLNSVNLATRAKIIRLKRIASQSPLNWANDFDPSCLARLESVSERYEMMTAD